MEREIDERRLKVLPINKNRSKNPEINKFEDFSDAQKFGVPAVHKKEDILNKKIVVIVNLEPAKLRGVDSNGMLLAADDGQGHVSLLVPDTDVGLGARVK